MPRPPNIIRPVKLKTSLPEDLRAWLDLHLWSATEGRVPHAAYKRLIETLLREYKAKIENPPNSNTPVQTTVEDGIVVHRHWSFVNGSASHNPGMPCHECDRIFTPF